MKVTHVSICPTEAASAAGRAALTPELLAATGARYSRNNEGLDSILAKIDPNNLDKSVDAIFKMVDYGHQSIADMAPVALFIDGVSIWMAYYIWTLCPTAGGQESSTRYIKLDEESLVDPEVLGIPEPDRERWEDAASLAFDTYKNALNVWEAACQARPEIARIPRNLLEDAGDKAARQVARMRRNFGFDRARYFLPVSCATNLMLIMSARGWAQLSQVLLSSPLREANLVGASIVSELELAAPRMGRHAVRKDYIVNGLREEFARVQQMVAAEPTPQLSEDYENPEHPSVPELRVMEADLFSTGAADLAHHQNRYAWFGDGLRRMAVRFSWSAVALAEIRDLNRHRTGTKWCPPVPRGFYCAMDQIAGLGDSAESAQDILTDLQEIGRTASSSALDLLSAGEPTYVYWTLLGTQFPFEHTTTADKFLYEAELRTGTGAHYKYAQHLHDILELWYARYPETRGLVLEGSAEPE